MQYSQSWEKDEEDEEILDAQEGDEDIADGNNDESIATPTPIDLLHPPHSTILASAPVTTITKPTKHKKKSPAHKALKNHGYSHCANGLQYIKDCLQQYKGNEISIKDLTWYISTKHCEHSGRMQFRTI